MVVQWDLLSARLEQDVYARYVDDILLLMSEEKIQFILQTFNDCHSKLKFRLEKPSHNQRNFWGITSTFNGCYFITNW